MKTVPFLTLTLTAFLSVTCADRNKVAYQDESPLSASINEARELQNNSQWNDAIDIYMEIIRTEPDEDTSAETCNIIREAMLQTMNICQSAGMETECVSMLSEISQNPTLYIKEHLWRDLHSIFAYALYRADRNDEAKEMMDKVLEMEYDDNDDRLTFRDYSYAAAIAFVDPQRQEEAVEYCKFALEAAKRGSIESGVQWTTSMLGRLYRKNGRMSDAMELYMNSVERAKESGDHSGLVNAYNCISEIYLFWRYPTEAENYSDSAMRLTDQVRARSASVAADTYRLRGKVKELKGESDSALYYLNKAQLIYEILPYNSGNDEIDKDLGSILIKSEDPSTRQMGMRMLERVIGKATRVEPRATAYVNLARMYEEQGDKEECCRNMRALTDLLIKDTTSVTYYIDEDACRYAFEHFLAEGKIDATDVFTRLYTQQVDRRSNDNVSRAMATSTQQEMRTRHNMQMKETTSLMITIIVLSVIIVIAIVIIFVILARIRRHRTVSRMTDLENEKNKIAEELEMMAEAIKKIDTGGIHESSPSNIPSIFRMNGESMFREKFEAQHPGFVDSLREAVPQISRNEEILCMMILLKQDLNQIAYYMGIEKASVNQARYRLRKKMGLGKDDSLKAKIQEINNNN